MAFVHRERRKVGEVTPTTADTVGPGAYLALVSRAKGQGYAPFASTERRTLDAGNVGLVNRTPGPGSFDTAKAAASVKERKGGAGRFGRDARGLAPGEGRPVSASPGPGAYAVDSGDGRSRRVAGRARSRNFSSRSQETSLISDRLSLDVSSEGEDTGVIRAEKHQHQM